MTDIESVQQIIQGSTMHLSPNDPGLSMDLIEDGIREPHTTEAYIEILEDLDAPTVVDIGANLGYYACMPCAVHDGATVLAIEPDPSNVALLRRTVDANGYGEQVTVIESGVSNESGTTTLYRTDESNCHTMNERKASLQRMSQTIEVPVNTLDAILEEAGIEPEAVDVIRMDVEGHEPAVIQGAEGLFDAVDEVWCNIEFHPILLGGNEMDLLRDRFGECEPVSVAQGDKRREDETVSGALRHNWAECVFQWPA